MPRSPAASSAPVSAQAESDLAYAARVLGAESRAVAGLAKRLGPSFTTAIDLIVACADKGGTVLVTGLGKSGLIGAKISATLASLGIPSHTVHPTEAAHGDLGRFRASDVCIALSYSGETDEVVALASLLRQDGVPIISITSGCETEGGEGASLDRLATAALTTGPVEEEAALSPAPACSTTAMLALGDALALGASRRRNFTDDDFARRHPGGTLGGLLRPITEALRFTVGKNLEPIPDDVSVEGALKQAAAVVRRPGALLLVSRQTGVLTGIFTDADLRRLILRDPSELSRPIRELMSRSPSTLRDDALVRDAVQLVREQRRDEIPVVDGAGRPIGLLDVQDLVAMKLVRE
ncbi:MAG: SIS domain-containing protein [Phycisphaerales bacterium]|nr:SIS domain-containing protein [Phycisphaerales bacterium]